jgi:photosystem II stability/assembly factor-like uncharacterized protein
MANVTTIYACTADGLAIFNKPGTLNEWLPPRRVLGGMPVRSVWAEAGPPVRIVLVQNGQLLVSENGGRAWEQAVTPSPAIALFRGVGERTIYASLEGGGLLCSNDGGEAWKAMADLPGNATGLIKAGDHFYLIASGSLYRGEPESGKWRLLSEDATAAVGFDEVTGRLYGVTPEGILMSEDSGEKWTLLAGSPPDVVALQVVPGAAGKPPALVAGTADGMTISPDGGESWHPTTIEQGVAAFARDPERRDRLYAGTMEGYIYESGNRGQSWSEVNSVPLSAVAALYIVRI